MTDDSGLAFCARSTANGTTQVGGTGGAFLHRIQINKAGATANLLSVYMGASAATGRLIGTIDTTVVRNFDYQGLFSQNGFTLVLATGTAADLTVVFG